MTKYNFEFYDLNELISHFTKNVNHNTSDVFDSGHNGDAFAKWCEHHDIDPYMIGVPLYDSEVVKRWQNAEDRENFYPPYLDYEFQVSQLVKDVNQFGIGTIDLNIFKDDINKAIGISEWSIYWKKYEGVVYSLNESFVSMFLPYSVGGILTVFDSGYFENASPAY